MSNRTTDFREQELPLRASGVKASFTLRTPANLCDHPALLLNLANERRRTLEERPYCLTSGIFLAAGHYVASFDLPNHGENVDSHGGGLAGMAAAVAAGIDVFDTIRTDAGTLIHTCIDRNLVPPGRIFACGTSRGGLAALHVLAAHRGVAASAIYAPVTHLAALTEFSTLAEHPFIIRNSALSLSRSLMDRPLYIAISPNDARVGTAHCLEFHERLSAVNDRVVLHMDSANGHRVSDAAHQRGAAFLLEQAALPQASAESHSLCRRLEGHQA